MKAQPRTPVWQWLHAAVDELAGKLGAGRPLSLVLQVIDDAPAGGGPEVVRVLMVSPLEPGVRTGRLATDGRGSLVGGVVEDATPRCPRCQATGPFVHPATLAYLKDRTAICPDQFHLDDPAVRCPSCGSTHPEIHPIVWDGVGHEIQAVCPDPFHGDSSVRCPRCQSHRPELHPATADGGEVIAVCPDPFHLKGTRP